MRIVIVVSIYLFLTVSCAQPKISVFKEFSKEAYLEDLHQLAQTLKSNHPQMFTFVNEEEFQELTNELANGISNGTKVGEFVWICRTLMAFVGCGHTYMPSQGERLYLPERLQFPLNVTYINNELIVLQVLNNKNKLQKGDIILTINDIPISELIARFKNRISADGYNEHFKMALINDSFSDYVAFELGFPNKYHVKTDQGRLVLVPSKNAISKTSNLAPCPSNLCIEIKDDKLAILTIRSFNFYGKQTVKFKTFVDAAFARISDAEVENLIIDIRGNGGGDPYCAAHLIQKFAKKPFQYYEDEGMGYKDLRVVLQPSANVFKGKIYIFTNGRNFSTSGHFCAVIKENRFATFAGTETGSTYSCNANQRSFVLDNTGLIGQVAQTTFRTKVISMPLSEGIKPEIPVSTTKLDVMSNRDEGLHKLINKILTDNE